MDKEKGHTSPQERSPAMAELPASERRRGRFAGRKEAERIWPLRKDNAVGMKESGCGRVTTDSGEQTAADWADESPLRAQFGNNCIRDGFVCRKFDFSRAVLKNQNGAKKPPARPEARNVKSQKLNN